MMEASAIEVPVPIFPPALPLRRPMPGSWTARRFFQALQELGPLRVISVAGPSQFEAFCEVVPGSVSGGTLKMVSPEYHWHVRLDGLGHLRSRDEEHERHGRRLRYFELREREEAEPFLYVHLYREPGEELSPRRAARFAEMHAELGSGCQLAGSRP